MGYLLPALLMASVAQGAEFKIICDVSGRHPAPPPIEGKARKPSPLINDPAVEIQILRDSLKSVYPKLPWDLQAVADQVTFMIEHRHEEMGRLYVGWSAEDDPDYRYPDQEFYPNGTIKVNIAPRVIEFLQVAYSQPERRSKTGELMPQLGPDVDPFPWWKGFIAHELRHAQQYRDKPLRDLRVPGACPEGLCDPALIEETRQKVLYEKQAFETEFALNPRTSWDNIHGLYEIQYLPAQIVRELVEAKDTAAVEALRRRWDEAWKANHCQRGSDLEVCADVRETYPYLKDVQARYERELQRRLP